MTIDLATLTVTKAHEHLVKGDFTAVELAQAYLSQIEKLDGDVRAYLEVYSDVLAQAKAVDARIADLKKRKDELINDITKSFEESDREIWGKVSVKLFPAVRDLFSSLIDSMEKNENALLEIIEQQRQTIAQQALNSK